MNGETEALTGGHGGLSTQGWEEAVARMIDQPGQSDHIVRVPGDTWAKLVELGAMLDESDTQRVLARVIAVGLVALGSPAGKGV